MTQASRGFEGRSTFIDALRGVAAFSVACYHITRYGPLPEPARQIIPGLLQGWFDHGWMGVQVFFVISGFVIAYSVRNARVTPGYLANYALRRSIRLDPPYWTTILFVLLLHAILHLQLGFDSPLDVPSKMEPALSWQLLASHLFYVQNIVASIQGLHGYPQFENLSAGFWTLCIEVQFYLLYVVGQGIAQQFPFRGRQSPADASPIGLQAVFVPLAVGSLFVWNAGFDRGENVWWNLFVSGPGGDMWITRFFCMFFLGASAWWALDGRIPSAVFWIYVAALAGRIAWQGQKHGWDDDLTVGLCAALAAGVATYIAGRQGRLGTWLNVGLLQYLGRISYSLYLIHFPMSHVVTTLGTQVSGTTPSPTIATLWLLAALAASLAAAHVMYIAIESPSVRFAARFKRAGQSVAVGPMTAAQPVKPG